LNRSAHFVGELLNSSRFLHVLPAAACVGRRFLFLAIVGVACLDAPRCALLKVGQRATIFFRSVERSWAAR
jgi:hypothetical protein